MKAIVTFLMVTLCIGVPGCGRAPRLTETASNATVSDVFDSAAARITNRFGMTFCLVTIDPKDPKHEETFPRQSYYLQQTELSSEHFAAYERLAGGSERDPADGLDIWRFPSEWREVSDLAMALSRVDPDYDYRLPTREEWRFACMNGYDQSCPGSGAKSGIDSTESKRPNKFGIEGFMNYDAECADVPGLFLGMLQGSTSVYGETERTSCRCDQFTTGNPDADDGLNELIRGRYVLIPK